MSLFNGLKFGRPAYPLYLADAFKPVEPTALGLLAQVSMMKGKAAKDADGTTKEEKVEALGGETSNWYDMQAETKALDDRNKAMFAKVFKNHSNDYQDTPEFKKVIYPNMMKVESNKQLLKKNAVIGKTHLEEYNKANADLVAKFSEDEFAYDKNFKLIMGDDGNPLTRGKYNQLVYQNKNVNKEGLFIDPDFQYGVEYKSAITRIAKDINDAKETETREGLIGPQGTIVPGTYATGKSGSTSNVRKLNEMSWAGSFKSTMSRPELEDAHLMYDHALLEGDGNAYKTEIIDDPDRKGQKKEVYSKDKDGNYIPIEFDEYMERVVEKVKTGKDIRGNSISMDYSGIPGWKEKEEKEQGIYYSFFTGNEYFKAAASPVEVNIGKTLTDKIKSFNTNKDLQNSKVYENIPDDYKIDVLAYNNYLIKNPNGNLESYLNSGNFTSERKKEIATKFAKLDNMELTKQATEKKDGFWGRGIYADQLDEIGKRSQIFRGVYYGGVKDPDNTNLTKLLLGSDISFNASVGGLAVPVSKKEQEASSFYDGAPIQSNVVLYGFDHTPFTLQTKDGKQPVIISSPQVTWIPQTDKQGNPLETRPEDEGMVTTYIMVTPDRLAEMKCKINVVENGKMVTKEVTYDSDEMEGLMDQYKQEVRLQDVCKTYDANGKEVINYEKYKDAGYNAEDIKDNPKMVIIPVMQSTRPYGKDAMNRLGRPDLKPNDLSTNIDVVSYTN